MSARRRPEAAEWPGRDQFDALAHGTPLLRDGRVCAAPRDASVYDRPNVRTPKQVHALVVYHPGHSKCGGIGPACAPATALDEDLISAADDVPAAARCHRPACAALFAGLRPEHP